LKFSLSSLFFLFIFSVCAQNPSIEKSIYAKHYENLTNNDYIKSLFQISTLNTDSILKHAKLSLPFNSENGAQLLRNVEITVPLNYYPEVAAYIELYTKGVNQHFLNYLINTYQEEIKTELKKQNLPDELNLLPAVLSNYNPNSNNSNGGEGFWHLHYAQAIKFGLTINENIDERRDLKKSTKAAVGYLKLLHQHYNNWELAIAAYSCGPSTINNLLRRKKAASYIEIYPYLNAKTRDLVPALSALIYTHTNNNSNMIKLDVSQNLDTLLIEKKLTYKALSSITNINLKELQFLNPTIINELFPANFIAKFPKNTVDKFKQLSDSIYFYQDSIFFKPVVNQLDSEDISDNEEEIIHKVKSGDVLGKIAEKYGVKIAQIQQLNNLKGTTIHIGQNLIVNKKKSTVLETPPSIKTKETTISDENFILYVVQEGDNLWDISLNYDNVTPDDIMELNNIDANLKVGQVLKIKKK